MPGEVAGEGGGGGGEAAGRRTARYGDGDWWRGVGGAYTRRYTLSDHQNVHYKGQQCEPFLNISFFVEGRSQNRVQLWLKRQSQSADWNPSPPA